MSANTLRAQVAFSFKAETYELATTVDLDQCVRESGEAPNFHLLLARASGIDPYSYLYEVLESHEIVFSDATGLAVHSCQGGAFDWVRFMRDWGEAQDLRVVSEIAQRTLGVSDLDAQGGLRAALLAAYRAGRASV